MTYCQLGVFGGCLLHVFSWTLSCCNIISRPLKKLECLDLCNCGSRSKFKTLGLVYAQTSGGSFTESGECSVFLLPHEKSSVGFFNKFGNCSTFLFQHRGSMSTFTDYATTTCWIFEIYNPFCCSGFWQSNCCCFSGGSDPEGETDPISLESIRMLLPSNTPPNTWNQVPYNTPRPPISHTNYPINIPMSPPLSIPSELPTQYPTVSPKNARALSNISHREIPSDDHTAGTTGWTTLSPSEIPTRILTFTPTPSPTLNTRFCAVADTLFNRHE